MKASIDDRLLELAEEAGVSEEELQTISVIDFAMRLADARANYDPTPWCTGCGAKKQANCKCGPLADND